MQNKIEQTFQFRVSAGDRERNHARANKLWRARNPDKVREYGRTNALLYRERHPERVKASKAKDYAAHRQQYIERSRAWRLANPERYKALMREAYLRQKAKKQAKRCVSCECLLKTPDSLVCEWCVATYKNSLWKKIPS